MVTLNTKTIGTSNKGEIKPQTNKFNLVEFVSNTKKLFSYAGSKEAFKEHFEELLEKEGVIEVNTFIEAFAGSLAALLINLQFVKAKKVVINDLNSKLINLYKQIQKNPEQVWKGYEMIEDKFESFIPNGSPRVRIFPKDRRDEIRKCEEFFKYIRNYVNTGELDDVHASCVLWVLNHNFNGLYTENKKGHINVSFNWNTYGTKRDEIKNNIENLSKIFNSKETEFVFEELDVDSLISKYNDHDTFIYLDPPYIDTDIQYNKKRNGQKNSFIHVKTHIDMLNSCSKYKYVMYSNNDHEDFQSFFKDSYLNFNRGKTVANKKSDKSKKEILGLMVNTPFNNVEYTPEESKLFFDRIDNKVSNNVNYSNEDYSIKVGTSFSGMGSPEYSLKQLGVNHSSEFVIEWDKHCQETLKRNHNPKQVFSDITKVKSENLNPCDLYVWGSPCQDFSLANNKRQGLNGEKSKLFYEGLRILKDLQPKYSILENVKGMLSSNGGEDFKHIMKEFKKLGNYNIYYKKINAVDMGGYTARVRVFVVLVRKDIDIEFKFPENIINNKSIKDCLIPGDYEYLDKSEYKPWKTPVIKQRGLMRKDFELITDKNRDDIKRIYNINHFCPTIIRHNKILINDGIGVRELSVLEQKKIQGFREDMDLSHLSNNQMKSQLGNTMEVETMKRLLGEIIRLDKLHMQSSDECLVA